MRTRSALGKGWLRLGALLCVLAGLVAYGVGSGDLRLFGLGSSWEAAAGGCPETEAPALAPVERSRMIGEVHLLEGIGAGSGGTPYEWGPAEPSYAWTDGEPGSAALPKDSPQPGGYEMRWWFPDGSDVVIDGFSFDDVDAARDFVELAASGECRAGASVGDARLPPEARHLSWVNPDGFAQEDAYLRLGQRVYRVSAVLPKAGDRVTGPGRREGFALVDRLACSLPGAGCVPEGGEPS